MFHSLSSDLPLQVCKCLSDITCINCVSVTRKNAFLFGCSEAAWIPNWQSMCTRLQYICISFHSSNCFPYTILLPCYFLISTFRFSYNCFYWSDKYVHKLMYSLIHVCMCPHAVIVWVSKTDVMLKKFQTLTIFSSV